jgi:hypothetical protein
MASVSSWMMPPSSWLLGFTVLRAGASNRSRWLTDPTREVLPRAGFTPGMSPALLRRDQWVLHDREQSGADLYRRFNLRSAVCERQQQAGVTLSLEVRAFATRMGEVDAKQGRDYEEEVHGKARVLGRLVPLLDSPVPLGGEPEGAS